ncbi:transposase [Patiriisocius sp. Uisw_017]|jgi:transposase-like protein|uniref:transposase n=1 Tax=Patiriisocius sp. Uisw_017 TaxID=3230968 RepID=UPI0039EB7D41
MNANKFSEGQIIVFIIENEQVISLGDLSREVGIDKSVLRYWRKKYGAMEQGQLKHL